MCAPVAALQNSLEPGGIVSGIATGQILRRAPGHAVIRRIPALAAHLARTHVEQQERTNRCGLVPARLAVHDEGTLDREPCQRLGNQPGSLDVEGPDDLVGRCGRIGQRTQQIEDRAHAEGLADRGQGFHGRMVVGRKQESEAAGLQAAGDPDLVQRDTEPQGLKHVSAAGTARHATVAVLDDLYTTRRRQQTRSRRQVQAPGTIAARADGVDAPDTGRDGRAPGQRPHGPREAPDLRRRLAFHPERRQHARGQRRGRLGIRQRPQQGLCLGLRQVLPRQQLLQRLSERQRCHHTTSRSTRPASPRKFSRSPTPQGVRMLSGWNCTPSMAALR